MTVDELIAKLKKLNRHLPVVVYDGSDPSNLNEVSRVDVEDLDFFHDKFGYSRDRTAVHLT